MFQLLLFLLFVGVYSSKQEDLALEQVMLFKKRTKGPIGTLTTSAGAPVEYNEAISTLNTNLLANENFVQTTAHLNRENIPERIVHPKGTGAFGYFETTHDISHICKAELFSEVGKKTPVAARLSMGVVRKGGPDLTREARGFSVKFYTKEGNFDIAGFNTPVFVAKEPLLFGTFAHSIKRNPATDFSDPSTLWDFLSLNPESLYMFLVVYSDPGIPDGYRRMPGHSIHTYGVYNATGTLSFVRFNFIPEGGMKNLNSTEAARLGAIDPDYCARDLYNAIGHGNFPAWKLYIQHLTQEDVKRAKFDVFDITKSLPECDYPNIPVGRMVLNRNAKNYFAEVEQLAFCPANLVPGILGSPDKAFEARRFSYRDAARYRLGTNFDKIKVNCPYRSTVLTYNRDGISPVLNNEDDTPNYFPNSFNGPMPYKDEFRPVLKSIYEKKPNNVDQCRDYYLKMSSGERGRTVENILATLCFAEKFIQDRAVMVLTNIHPDLGKRVTRSLKVKKCRQRF